MSKKHQLEDNTVDSSLEIQNPKTPELKSPDSTPLKDLAEKVSNNPEHEPTSGELLETLKAHFRQARREFLEIFKSSPEDIKCFESSRKMM